MPPEVGRGRWRGRRWPEWLVVVAIPLLVFGAVGGAFALWKPNIATSSLGSLQAMAITAAVLVVAAGLALGLWRVTHRVWVGVVAGLVPVLLFLAYTIGPVFRDVLVVDPAPSGLTSAAPTPAASPPNPELTAPVRAQPFPPITAVPSAPVTTPSSPGPSGPVVVGSARLRGIDHRAAGTVLLIREPDGGVLVRFEDLNVEPGPDYHVHLVPGRDRQDPGGTHLGALRGNRGDQNYPAPAGTSTEAPVTVLIWCRAFSVPIANATIT
jgi:hypothetical protein